MDAHPDVSHAESVQQVRRAMFADPSHAFSVQNHFFLMPPSIACWAVLWWPFRPRWEASPTRERASELAVLAAKRRWFGEQTAAPRTR
jgi:hypothetical protein